MSNFSRNNRTQLLDKLKLKKYLLNAIGEIGLVVIGILLALQVTNWSEKIKIKKDEKKILIALKEEYQYNLKAIREVSQKESDIETSMKKALYHTGPKFNNISEPKFRKLLAGVIKNRLIFSPSVGVLQDLLNSGQLSELSNVKLRRKLAAWESNLIKISHQESVIESYRDQIKNITIEKGNLANHFVSLGTFDVTKEDLGPYQFTEDPRKILSDIRFENLIMYKIASSRSVKRDYNKLESDIDEILMLIDESFKE